VAVPETTPDFTTVEDALFTAVREASGLPEAQLLLSDEDVPSPLEQDYLTLKMDGPFPLAGGDPETWKFDPQGENGQEMVLTGGGPAELVCSLQAYTKKTNGSDSAQALLARVQAQLRLTPRRASLKAAGLSLFDLGRVQRVPRVYGPATEGRAFLDLRLYVHQGAVFRTGYIATCTPTITYRE
jgi:hypothetical protein